MLDPKEKLVGSAGYKFLTTTTGAYTGLHLNSIVPNEAFKFDSITYGGTTYSGTDLEELDYEIAIGIVLTFPASVTAINVTQGSAVGYKN